VLENNYAHNAFGTDKYAQALAMSKSQLYRWLTALTGYAPNHLLKVYRLEKVKELLPKKTCNIAEVAFETGFTNPSYFTKCFKTTFGLLPLKYLDFWENILSAIKRRSKKCCALFIHQASISWPCLLQRLPEFL
jgi:AraC-like DNA-binding protein